MIEEYKKLCSEKDCFKVVEENDIERNNKGEIYERSKKCWNCRTELDRKAIKRWRKNQRKNIL